MRLIGREREIRKSRADKSASTPDDEYQELAHAHSDVGAKIRDLEGFIDQAPQIQRRRKLETQVTLPPPEDEAEAALAQTVATLEHEEEGDEAEDPQERYGRRHLAAMQRARRINFYIFLVSAAAVAAFLYWVSLVVQ